MKQMNKFKSKNIKKLEKHIFHNFQGFLFVKYKANTSINSYIRSINKQINAKNFP